MNIEFSKYYLSQTIQAHNGIVRSLLTKSNLLLTASGDKTAKTFELKEGKYESTNTLSYFDNFLYSCSTLVGGGFAVGCDKNIYILTEFGDPLKVLAGHEGAVCSLHSVDDNTLISGSWDGTAIVWDLKSDQPRHRLTGHKYGVAVTSIGGNSYLTGSQDGILRLWEGEKEIRQVQAHTDIIREIGVNQEVDCAFKYLTCSNDETVKLWSTNLEPILTLHGHKGFVFTAKQVKNLVVSGGDDRCVLIWQGDELLQTLKFPGSVWTLAGNDLGDIIVGTNDGKIRVFSQDLNRQAQKEEIDLLEQESQVSEVKQDGGLSEEELKKLPSVSQLTTLKGKKEGEIRLFKNNEKAEAYMWSMESGSWQLIGDVLGGKPQKRYYPGDQYFPAGEYDYLFDVESDRGGNSIIPFNEGGNTLDAAEKFCAREGYSKHYLSQVINFLKSNTQSGKQQQPQAQTQQRSQPAPQAQVRPSQGQPMAYKYIPFTQYFLYEQMNLQGLQKKIAELNQQVGELAMTEKELLYFTKGIDLLGLGGFQQQPIDQVVWQTFLSKLIKWPMQMLAPVYDFLRIFCLHFSSESLFSGLDRGINLFLELQRLTTQAPNQVLIRVILQTLCNCFVHNANTCGILYHIEIVGDLISGIENPDEKTAICISNLLLNLSIAIYQKPGFNNKAPQTLSKLIYNFIDGKEVECQTKGLTAIGNMMLTTSPQVQQACKEVCRNKIMSFSFSSQANEAAAQCLQEVKMSIN